MKLSSGIQQWTVPYTGEYRLVALGAAGGYDKTKDEKSSTSSYRGRGARMVGTFSLSKGEIIHILVGQEGTINNSPGGNRLIDFCDILIIPRERFYMV